MKKYLYLIFVLAFGLVLTSCHKHQFTEEVVNPTCTEEGYTINSCTCGGYTFIDDKVPAIGHIPGEWTVTKEPELHVDGTKEATCITCGEIVEEAVPALDEVYPIYVGNEVFNDIDAALAYAIENGRSVNVLRGSHALTAVNGSVTINLEDEATLSVAGTSATGHDVKIKGGNIVGNLKTSTWYVYNFLDAKSVVYEDCVITGSITCYADSTTFIDCTFNTELEDMYSVYCYDGNDATFDGCTFDNYWGKAIKLYDEGNYKRTLTVKDCSFTAEVEDKAAIEIDGSLSKGYTVYISNSTVSGVFKKLWNADAGEDKNMIVYVDGVIEVCSQTQLANAMNYVQDTETTIHLLPGTYSVPSGANGKAVVLVGEEGTIIDASKAIGLHGTTLTLKNVTVEGSTANYIGYQHTTKVVFDNCVINKGLFLYATEVLFNECEFNLTSQYVWTYTAGEVTFTKCVFNTEGKAILIYAEGGSNGQTVNINECEFNASKQAFTYAGDHCAAIEIDSSLINGNYTLNFGDVKVDDNFAGIYRIKSAKKTNVVINHTVLTADDLALFAKAVNNGNTFNGYTITLGADIDLNNVEWTPIGNSTTAFEGTFDGANHVISNLKITANPSMSNAGLFGVTKNGTIKNLVVENAEVKGRLNVGVVAGTPYTSKYENITVKGDVKVEGMAYVGGIGGKNAYANWTNITVDANEGSYVKANSVENGVAYRTYVGGVIGFMGEGGHTFSNISSNINVIGSTIDVGGITGIAHYGNNFVNVTCSGNVTLENAEAEEDALEAGGIAGVWHNQDGYKVTFTNCVFTGTLKAFVNGVEFTAFQNNGLVGKGYSAAGTGELIIQTVTE